MHLTCLSRCDLLRSHIPSAIGVWMALLPLAALLSTPASASAPQLPASFDKPLVQSLIEHVDEGQNAIILRMGYFARRGPQPFDQQAGLALLSDAVQKAETGSKKWFLLKSMQAFALLHVAGGDPGKAFAAYQAVFEEAGKAEQAGAVPALDHALYEFTVEMPGDLGVRRGRGLDAAQAALPAAVTAYLLVLHDQLPQPYPIRWMRAIGAVVQGAKLGAKQADAIGKPVMDAVSDPAFPRSYALYEMAAAVVQACDPDHPDRAEKLLRVGIALPAVAGQGAERGYDDLVRLLTAQGRLKDAVAAQRERVERTGTGYAGLLDLYGRLEDIAGVSEVVRTVQAPGVADSELVDTAAVLARLAAGDKTFGSACSQAIDLLSRYLTRQGPRDIGQELRARFILAEIYASQGKAADARKVIDGAQAKPPFASALPRRCYTALQMLRDRLKAAPPGSAPAAAASAGKAAK